MTLAESAKPRSGLAPFLKFLRTRIDPQVRDLGPRRRLPSRVGKRVTQEELAEAIGVSREWYAVLESPAAPRASPSLLERLSDALMLSSEERGTLFQLALPEICGVKPSDEPLSILKGISRRRIHEAPRRDEPHSTTELGPPEISSTGLESRYGTILQAFARMRSTAKRLWSASELNEALEVAAEEVGAYFANADLIASFQRVEKGRWKHLFVVDGGSGTRNANMWAELASSLPDDRYDEVVLYPLLSAPGDIGSRDTYRATRVRSAYEEGLVKYKLTGWSFLHARISSRSGIVAGITVKHARRRDYSETEREIIGAIASMASLALS